MKKNSILEKDINSVINDEKLFEKLKHTSILITGATGFVGSMLLKVLYYANRKYNLNLTIYGYIRDYNKAKNLFGNLLEEENVKLCNTYDVKSDFIIHTVSATNSRFFVEHPVETIKSSVENTIKVLEVAKNNKAVVVYLSSMEQYGIPYKASQVMTEDKVGIIDHLNIRSSYSESKRLCECLCVSYVQEYGVDVKIARLAQTVGAGVPLSDDRMPMQFARAVVEKKNIVLHTSGRSVINFVYLTDALTGILTIMIKGVAGEAYNICADKETRSVKEIAELVVKELANEKIEVKVEISNENMGYAPETKMYLNSRKLRSLGWSDKVGMVDAYKKLISYLEGV